METISLTDLSDSELLARLQRLAQTERRVTSALVSHLAEIDRRKLYLREGCSSLFVYCMRVLHLSEHAAYFIANCLRPRGTRPRVRSGNSSLGCIRSRMSRMSFANCPRNRAGVRRRPALAAHRHRPPRLARQRGRTPGKRRWARCRRHRRWHPLHLVRRLRCRWGRARGLCSRRRPQRGGRKWCRSHRSAIRCNSLRALRLTTSCAGHRNSCGTGFRMGRWRTSSTKHSICWCAIWSARKSPPRTGRGPRRPGCGEALLRGIFRPKSGVPCGIAIKDAALS